MIEGISGVALDTVAKSEKIVEKPQANFVNWLENELMETNSKIIEAETQTQKLALGEADNLHQVMTSISVAKTQFEMTVQVRNRLLEGFQEIMRMSI